MYFRFIWEREREREISHVFAHSAMLSLGLDQAQVRNQNSTWISHVGGQDPGTWAVTCCLPRCPLVGRWAGEQSSGLELRHAELGCRCPKWHLNHRSKHPPVIFLNKYSLRSVCGFHQRQTLYKAHLTVQRLFPRQQKLGPCVLHQSLFFPCTTQGDDYF